MKILFISHETTLTGAPKVLLLFLKWVKANRKDVVVDVLTLRGGNLSEEFKHSCNHFYDFSALTQYKKPSLFERILMKFRFKKKKDLKEKWIGVLSSNHYDVIYANSIPSLEVAVTLKRQSKFAKLLLHLHELDTVLNMYLNKSENTLCDVNQFIAASSIVKANLVDNWDVEKNKIEVVYEFSEVSQVDLKRQSKQFVVGASGTVETRKGTDVFIQIARLVNKTNPDSNIKFVWVGKDTKESYVQGDLKKLNLINSVKFVGEQTNPINHFNEFDIFLMTSREDPFPLVCIEVANLKKPIICFEGASGTQEILEHGGGYVVPYFDVEAMTEKIMFYFNNPEAVAADGQKAQQLFSKFTPEQSCPLIYKIVEDMVE